MKNKTEITVNGNLLSVEILYHKEEMYFLKKFIWPRILCKGKQIEISENNSESVCLTSDGIDIKIAFSEQVSILTAYDTIKALEMKIIGDIENLLTEFWNEREKWEEHLIMTINALGLNKDSDVEVDA